MARKCGKPSGAVSAVMLLMLFGLGSMSTLVMYQRKVILDTHSFAQELRLSHEVTRSLGRALKDINYANAKQKEESAAIAHEERFLKKAEGLLGRQDGTGAGQILVQEVLEEAASVDRTMVAAKDLEVKARSDQVVVEGLLQRVSEEDLAFENKEDGHVAFDLESEHKQDVVAMEMFNKTLVEFETVDKALEARQSAIRATLERLKHSFGQNTATPGLADLDVPADTHAQKLEKKPEEEKAKAKAPSDPEALLEHEKQMAKKARHKETDAKQAVSRAEKLLKEGERLVKKRKTKDAVRKLKEEEKEEQLVTDALAKTQSLLEKARLDIQLVEKVDLTDKVEKVEQAQHADFTRLERQMKELQEKRDAIRERHDHLSELIKKHDKEHKKHK